MFGERFGWLPWLPVSSQLGELGALVVGAHKRFAYQHGVSAHGWGHLDVGRRCDTAFGHE